MPRRLYQRLSRATAKSWLTAGALLGVGLLPCPDCGTPMIFHVWPIVVVLIARAAKERRLKREQARSGPCQPKNDA